MVLDTSAIIAIIRREPEAPDFLRHLKVDPVRLVSVVSIVETGIVLEKQFGVGGAGNLRMLSSASDSVSNR